MSKTNKTYSLIRVDKTARDAMNKHLAAKKKTGIDQWPRTFASRAIVEKIEVEKNA